MKTNFLKKGKFLLSLALLLSLSVVSINCSKEDVTATTLVEPVLAPLQDPLPGFLAATGFDQTTLNSSGIYYIECGYSFIPLVNGKMTAVVLKVPVANPEMRVTVWNKLTQTIVRTEIINVPTANVEVIKQIIALELVKDKEYIISFNSADYFIRKRTNGLPVAYPFVVGDIKITGNLARNGIAQSIPVIETLNNYGGDCSFKFQK